MLFYLSMVERIGMIGISYAPRIIFTQLLKAAGIAIGCRRASLQNKNSR